MQATIMCKKTAKGVHSFYLFFKESEYFLFNQNYRKGVHEYFSKGVPLESSRDYAKANKDSAVIRTMTKLPLYIKYIEKEYGLAIFEKTKKKKEAVNNGREYDMHN